MSLHCLGFFPKTISGATLPRLLQPQASIKACRTMDDGHVYLAMRTTYSDPRLYGARLAVPDTYRQHNSNGDMDSTCFDKLVWDQAAEMVHSTYGKEAWDVLVPHEDTSDTNTPCSECMYVMDAANTRFDLDPMMADHLIVKYRIPGAHVNEDTWKPLGHMQDVKTIKCDNVSWFVAAFGKEKEAFLFVPGSMAKNLLVKRARHS